MKRITFLLFALIIGGCVSAGESPPARFYMLSSLAREARTRTSMVPKNTIIEVGPVKIPNYQNRPQIVTESADKMLTIAEFDRWGEFLDAGMARIISGDLAWMLPGAQVMMFPSNYAIPVDYQVVIEVVQLRARLDGEILFTAQWSLIEPEKNKMLFTKRSEFRRDIKPQNYAGLSDALSSICLSLSSEISEAIAEQAGASGEQQQQGETS